MLTPDEIADVHPLTSPDGVLAALHQPGDAMVNPGWSAAAMALWAHRSGVTVREGVRVLELRRRGAGRRPRVTGVVTDQGVVEAERVVLCCGLWTRDLAASVGAVVPLYAAEHVHVTTAPIPGATPDLPLLRDLDGSLYIRHHRGSLMVGAFEPKGKPRATTQHRRRTSPSASSSPTGSTSHPCARPPSARCRRCATARTSASCARRSPSPPT